MPRTGWKSRLAIAAAVALAVLLLTAAVLRRLAPSSNTALQRFDVILVLGYPADSDGNPTPEMLARVTEGVHEYNRGIAPRLLFTGGPAHNQFAEADGMARAAAAQGIPPSAILVEPRAQDTIQNACLSVRILQAHGWRSAEVVSSAYHLPRAGLIFSREPILWRTHAAPSLAPQTAFYSAAVSAAEILKTARYLLYARFTESCPA